MSVWGKRRQKASRGVSIEAISMMGLLEILGYLDGSGFVQPFDETVASLYYLKGMKNSDGQKLEKAMVSRAKGQETRPVKRVRRTRSAGLPSASTSQNKAS